MKKQEINDLNALMELHYLMKDKLSQKSLHSLCVFFVKDNKIECFITNSMPKDKNKDYSFDINERNVLLYFFNNDFLFNLKEMVINTSDKYFKKFKFETLIPVLEKRLIFDNVYLENIIEKDTFKKRI